MRVSHLTIAVALTAAFAAAQSAHASGSPRVQADPMVLLTIPDNSTRPLSESDRGKATGWMMAMQDQLDQLMGTVYRYGSSSSRNGFDCSGLVVYVFSKLGLPEMPRSAFGMAQKGLRVDQDELQFGDLVFFNTRGRMYSHVGIYTGNGRFVHASTTSRRVIESSMSETYYRARFNGARRIIGTL